MTRIAPFAAALAIGATQLDAQDAVPDFASYRAVVENNVFDPDRGRPPPQTPRSPEPAPEPPDFIDITGVLVRHDSTVVFCSGSREGWNGTFTIGDELAGWSIVHADTHAATLTRPDNRQHMVPVGSRLTERDGDWSITQRTPADPQTDTSEAPRTEQTDSGTGTGVGDLLQKLRERRMKELNR